VVPNVLILSLFGTPYEMGYAHGQLLATQIQQLIPDVGFRALIAITNERSFSF
jgi:hypothetical protein